jgi:hypothetical protein
LRPSTLPQCTLLSRLSFPFMPVVVQLVSDTIHYVSAFCSNSCMLKRCYWLIALQVFKIKWSCTNWLINKIFGKETHLDHEKNEMCWNWSSPQYF